MPLNDFILGLNTLEGTNEISSYVYNQVIEYGQQIIEYEKIVDYVMTYAQLDAITLNDVVMWDSDTIFWADYNGSLDAGNIINLAHTITSWNIKRLKDGSTSLVDIVTVDPSVTEYFDYMTQNNTSYTYFLFPQSDYEVGQSLMTNDILVSFDHWSIIDTITNEVFILRNNINSGTGTHDIDRTTYPNFTKYEKISRGLRNFRKGTIQCMNDFDYVTGYYDTNYINDLETFINNGNFKYLKTLKGELLIVDVFNFQITYQDVIGNQPFMFSFDYEQVQDYLGQ